MLDLLRLSDTEEEMKPHPAPALTLRREAVSLAPILFRKVSVESVPWQSTDDFLSIRHGDFIETVKRTSKEPSRQRWPSSPLLVSFFNHFLERASGVTAVMFPYESTGWPPDPSRSALLTVGVY